MHASMLNINTLIVLLDNNCNCDSTNKFTLPKWIIKFDDSYTKLKIVEIDKAMVKIKIPWLPSARCAWAIATCYTNP